MTTSYKGRRDKGIRGEREVMTALQQAGFEVRGLEGRGDHLASKKGEHGPVILHVEVKRQETLRIDAWSEQAETEAPSVATPLVAYRRSGQPWRVSLRLDDLLKFIR